MDAFFFHTEKIVSSAPTRAHVDASVRRALAAPRERTSVETSVETRRKRAYDFFYSFRTSILQRSFHVASRIPIPIRTRRFERARAPALKTTTTRDAGDATTTTRGDDDDDARENG